MENNNNDFIDDSKSNEGVEVSVDSNGQAAVKVSKIDAFFGVTKNGSSIKTEIIAGLVTFLSMCYILTLNPTIIVGAGPLWSSVFIATALGAIIGTFIMAVLGKMPFALASGLGLNSMVSLLISGVLIKDKVFSYGTAMFLVFISGILFLIVSLVPVSRNKITGEKQTLRELVFVGMPLPVRKAISVGIGLFIAFIGLQNAGIIVDSPATLVTLLDLNDPANWELGGAGCAAMVAIIGFILISVLSAFKIKGSIIIGILVATLVAIPLKVTSFDTLLGKGDVSWAFWENFANYFKTPDEGGVFLALFRDLNFPQGAFMSCVMVVITFSMIDMFDTMGTVVGCATNAGLVDENGKPFYYNRIMMSDSIATVIGSFFGTSTVTTFVESGSGIAAGGKTGLTALTTSILFLLSIFLLPVFAFIPAAACASALFYVGVLMMGNIKDIDFTNPLSAVPAFATIIFMPLAYSITDGIGIGMLTYIIVSILVYLEEYMRFKRGKREIRPQLNVSLIAIIFGLLFLVYFFVPINI